MRLNLLKTILNFAVTSQLKVEAAVNKALTHFAARKETNLLLRSTRRVSSCLSRSCICQLVVNRR